MASKIVSPGVTMAIGSALLFGASTPLAKLMLGTVDPWLLAGLLYLGSGVGLAMFSTARERLGAPTSEASLKRPDLPWLGAVILFGGVLGPLFLMVGLVSAQASAAALLLNIESVATMVIAWVAFRENVDKRLMFGAVAILAGAALLSWQGQVDGFGWGALAIVAACVCWGVDNNLTRKLSTADPVQIATLKGLVAGSVNLAIALTLGNSIPAFTTVVSAGLLGLFGYGASLVLFILALRHLGAARTGAYYSLAPFIGAVLAIAVFDEPISARLLVAGGLMAIGLWLHLSERHTHVHEHEPTEHDHRHVHDEHHQHGHAPDHPPGEPHSHPHRHARQRHRHVHYPDIHHRHSH